MALKHALNKQQSRSPLQDRTGHARPGPARPGPAPQRAHKMLKPSVLLTVRQYGLLCVFGPSAATAMAMSMAMAAAAAMVQNSMTNFCPRRILIAAVVFGATTGRFCCRPAGARAPLETNHRQILLLVKPKTTQYMRMITRDGYLVGEDTTTSLKTPHLCY